MKHNKLVSKLLRNFDSNKKIYFQDDNNKAIPLGVSYYEVDNVLVLFKSKDDSEVGSVKMFLTFLGDNYYTQEESKDEDYCVALANITEWTDDDKGEEAMYAIVNAIELEDRILLTTVKYDSDTSFGISNDFTLIGTNTLTFIDFKAQIKALANSDKYKDVITLID